MIRKTPSRHPRDQHDSGREDEQADQHAAGHQGIAPGASAMPSGSQGGEQETYAVGYGRPPLHSRFKPGQSGNPRGRAKQSQNLRTIVKLVSNEQIQIREGDRPRRMPRIEALVRTTFTRAFKDPKALAALLVLLRQCGYGADHDEPAGDMLFGPDYPAIIDDFLARNGAKNAASDDEVDTTVSVTVNSAKREG
jgi:Family of unknown function (DUF5681)